MTTLLQLKTSLFADNSQSNQLSDAFVERWLERPPGRTQRSPVYLAAQPVPHLDQATFQAFLTPPEARDAEAKRSRRPFGRTDRRAPGRRRAAHRPADVQLRRAVDAQGLLRPRRARRHHLPLLPNTARKACSAARKAYVVATRGGRHAGTAFDTQSAFVRHFLGFIGITEVGVHLRRRVEPG
jgi:Acyl carrier protein phosphodiesterase